MQDLFWDEVAGGFFFTGRDAERLLVRRKEVYDGALPAGNSVAALVLARLAHLTGDTSLAELAQRQLEAFAAEVARYPAGHTCFLLALEWALGPASEVVVAGSRGNDETERMLRLLQEGYLPQTAVLFHPRESEGHDLEELAPFLREQTALDGRATAYVCRAHACQAPVQTADALVHSLKG